MQIRCTRVMFPGSHEYIRGTLAYFVRILDPYSKFMYFDFLISLSFNEMRAIIFFIIKFSNRTKSKTDWWSWFTLNLIWFFRIFLKPIDRSEICKIINYIKCYKTAINISLLNKNGNIKRCDQFGHTKYNKHLLQNYNIYCDFAANQIS